MLIAIVLVVGGYNIYLSQVEPKMSDLALANVEALADGDNSESGGTSHKCYKKWRKAPDDDSFALWDWICQECEPYWLLEADYKSTCIK